MAIYVVTTHPIAKCDDIKNLNKADVKRVQILLDAALVQLIDQDTSPLFDLPAVVNNVVGWHHAITVVAGAINTDLTVELEIPKSNISDGVWNETDDGGHEGDVTINPPPPNGNDPVSSNGWSEGIGEVTYGKIKYSATVKIHFVARVASVI